MEPNENQLNSYYHHQSLHHHHHPPHPHHLHHHHNQPPSISAASPTNGLLPPSSSSAGGDGGAHMVYPHSVPSSAAVVASPSQLEPAKRKRGRPRKYGTPEQALAAKKAATASSHSATAAAKEKKDHAGASSPSYSAASSSSAKKSQLAALGNAGQGFTPHVISVSAGEDVGQKIMMFMQQSKREICILSASGSISNVSLRQPAASGGNISYNGQFSIISFSGSYVRNEAGVKSGGLSVCLANTDGHIIGGGVGGPLKAAGPVQVIVGTFLIDTKKDVNTGAKGDGSSGMKLPSSVGVTSPSGVGFRSGVDAGLRNPMRGNDEQQAMGGGGHFMVQPRGIHVTPSRPTEWRPGPDARTASAFELTGRVGLAAHQSPENGDYDQIPD